MGPSASSPPFPIPRNIGEFVIRAELLDRSAVTSTHPADAYSSDMLGKTLPGGLPEWEIPGGCNNPGLRCLTQVTAMPHTLASSDARTAPYGE